MGITLLYITGNIENYFIINRNNFTITKQQETFIKKQKISTCENGHQEQADKQCNWQTLQALHIWPSTVVVSCV